MKRKILLPVIVLAFAAIFTTCEKHESDNKANLDPATWAPQSLQVEDISISEKKLTWVYDGDDWFDGYKLDRKKGDEAWQVAYQIFPKETRFWNDTEIIPDTTLIYSYRLYAFAGTLNSDKIEKMSYAVFICGRPFTDGRDGNEYETVQIGEQCWMKENLAFLPDVSHPRYKSKTSPLYYIYGNQETNVAEAKTNSNYQTYGVLYNWPAALIACPQTGGWHLPSDEEWSILSEFLGGSDVAGGKMKVVDTVYWNSPNADASNSSGFSGLPGGYFGIHSQFVFRNYIGYWWSSTDFSSPSYAWNRYISYRHGHVNRYNNNKWKGYSIRCLKE